MKSEKYFFSFYSFVFFSLYNMFLLLYSKNASASFYLQCQTPSLKFFIFHSSFFISDLLKGRRVVPGRVELPTSTLSVQRSNQLSYRTVNFHQEGFLFPVRTQRLENIFHFSLFIPKALPSFFFLFFLFIFNMNKIQYR